MKINKAAMAAAVALFANAAYATPLVSGPISDATALANAIVGPGVSISNAVFWSNGAQVGTFTNGASTVGFDSGIVMTTGMLGCVQGPNTQTNCSDNSGYSFAALRFDFTSTTGKLFFSYVFGSEEYNEYVGSSYNDQFQLFLDGNNIALIPGTNTAVAINNVNCGLNSAYYRNNSAASSSCPSLNLDIQYDGLTKVLVAEADVSAGLHSFEFRIEDMGDSFYDSGVFVQAGSFSGTDTSTVAEPASLALTGLGLASAIAARRRKRV